MLRAVLTKRASSGRTNEKRIGGGAALGRGAIMVLVAITAIAAASTAARRCGSASRQAKLKARAPDENIRIDLYLKHARHVTRILEAFGGTT